MKKPSCDARVKQSLADKSGPEEIRTFQKRLSAWYQANQRALPWRASSNPYHIWVSEVMLQQTQVATVIDYFNRFIRQFPDIPALAAANPDSVLKAWEGLGYYSRARHLQKAAQQLTVAAKSRVPDTPERFILLPGVGDYINAAVQSIAFGHALPVVDGNVKRVLARLFLKTEPVNRAGAHTIWRDLAALLLDHQDPGTWNQAMMELGALICTPRLSRCHQCPVKIYCGAFFRQRVGEFPARAATKKTPHRHLTAGIIFKKNKVLLVRRPGQGLLGGLWEFPGGPVQPGQSPESACREAIHRSVRLTIGIDTPLGRVRHAYTHFTIDLDAFICRFVSGRVRLNGPDDFCWISPEALSRYPLHKAVHKLLPGLKKKLEKA